MRMLFSDKRGNVAMIFALCLLPLLVMVGGVIDMSRQRGGEGRAQDALDAALLAVAKNADGKNDSQLTRDALVWFQNHLNDPSFSVESFTVTRVDDGLRAEITGGVETLFLGLIGIEDLGVTRSAEVQVGLTKIELALVLDTTGSMGATPSGQSQTKLESLQNAAKRMVTTLDALSPNDSMIEIGIVPFATYVNVGADNDSAPWIDTGGVSPVHGDNLVEGINRFDLYEHLGAEWKGCVMARPAPYDVDDTRPRTSRPETLFVPLFHPDEPDRTGRWEDYPNNYVDDPDASFGIPFLDLGNPVKYGVPWEIIRDIPGLPQSVINLLIGPVCVDGLDPNNGEGQECGTDPTNPVTWTPVDLHPNYRYYSDVDTEIGPSFSCEMRPITPLTSNYAVLRSEIDSLVSSGSTNISEGVSWGLRVLSPQYPFREADQYSSKVQKVMVVLSDGNNMIVKRDGHPGGSDFSAYGYMENRRLEGVEGRYDQQEILDAMDARTQLACQNAKAVGIRVFTIRLALEDDRSENLLTECASDPEDFIDVQDSDDLDEAFAEIADRISILYLSH